MKRQKNALRIAVISLFTFFFLFSTAGATPNKGATIVKIPQSNSLNEEIAVALDSTRAINSLSLTGNIEFENTKGYFKVVLIDTSNREYLVYREIGTFYSPRECISLEDEAYETISLENVHPKKLVIYTNNCKIRNGAAALNYVSINERVCNTMHKSPSHRAQLQSQNIRKKEIERINRYNKEHNILWTAKETSFSSLPYEVRKNVFSANGDEISTYGWEYYAGGILTPFGINYDSLVFYETTTAPYVEKFSWADRHGKNWNTPTRNQMYPKEVGGCWAYAALSAIEAYINLYCGEKIDEELSIQELLCCSDPHISFSEYGLGAYGPRRACEYIAKVGLMSEADFPLNRDLFTKEDRSESEVLDYCDLKPTLPRLKYQVDTDTVISISPGNGDPNSHVRIMEAIMHHGPGAVTINEFNHVMSIIGWGVVKPGLFLDYWPADWDPFMVTKDHPLANKVYWIFKNSVGDDWGYNGYACLVRAESRFPNVDSTPKGCVSFDTSYFFDGILRVERNGIQQEIPKKAFDEDGDGYYRWGFVGKPDGILELEDSDDSDPTVGPMNEYGIANKLQKTDLFIRDSWKDRGDEPNTIDKISWESPDIILTSSLDGTEHENPIHYTDTSKPLYARVTIHNIGTAPSPITGLLRVSWSVPKLSSLGDISEYPPLISDSLSNPNVTPDPDREGIICHKEQLPIINPGDSATITLKWFPPFSEMDYFLNKNINVSLMAEVVCIDDPYYNTNNGWSQQYVLGNNNVAKKSVSITNLASAQPPLDQDNPEPGDGKGDGNTTPDDDTHPHDGIGLKPIPGGTTPLLICTNSTNRNCRLRICGIEENSSIFDEAEIRIIGNEDFLKSITTQTQLEGICYDPESKMFQMTQQCGIIEGLYLQENANAALQLQINFLTQKLTSKDQYTLRVVLEDVTTNAIIDGYTYTIKKPLRNNEFKAIITTKRLNDNEAFTAEEIGEKAQYCWRDAEGHLIIKGQELNMSRIQGLDRVVLEVTATKDGFRDYAMIEIPYCMKSISPILSVTPNPTKDIAVVKYRLPKTTNTELVISSISGNYSHKYTIDSRANEINLNLSSFAQGYYTLTLYQEGEKVAEAILQKSF